MGQWIMETGPSYWAGKYYGFRERAMTGIVLKVAIAIGGLSLTLGILAPLGAASASGLTKLLEEAAEAAAKAASRTKALPKEIPPSLLKEAPKDIPHAVPGDRGEINPWTANQAARPLSKCLEEAMTKEEPEECRLRHKPQAMIPLRPTDPTPGAPNSLFWLQNPLGVPLSPNAENRDGTDNLPPGGDTNNERSVVFGAPGTTRWGN
jgi:hypothetical protein